MAYTDDREDINSFLLTGELELVGGGGGRECIFGRVRSEWGKTKTARLRWQGKPGRPRECVCKRVNKGQPLTLMTCFFCLAFCFSPPVAMTDLYDPASTTPFPAPRLQPHPHNTSSHCQPAQ